MTESEMARPFKRLHADRRGRAMIEIILILGAIALPLLIVLIVFGSKIVGWVSEFWGQTESGAEDLSESEI